MATEEITISELELADEILGDMNIPVDTATETRAVTLKQLKAWLGSSLPTGFIIPAVGKISDERFTLLDGKTLSREGTYLAFCNKVVSEVQAGNWFACSEEEYAQDISDFGQCGKFVVSNDYVRIPTITRFIGSTVTLSEIGKTYKESLPNITGGFSENTASAAQNIQPNMTYGAFTTKDNSTLTGVLNVQSLTSTLNKGSVYLDASRSSSTYQDGAKVQPDHTKYPYYMVVSTEGQTAKVGVDINKVYEDMNLKANTNLSNVASVSSSFKNASVSWGLPDYSAGVGITYPNSSHKFTAPSDGIIVLFNFWDGTGNFTTDTILYINNVATSFRGQSGNSYYENGNGTIVAYLSKGDEIYLSRNARSTRSNTFYPLKGVN